MSRGGDVETAALKAVVEASELTPRDVAQRLGWTRVVKKTKTMADGLPHTYSWTQPDASRVAKMLGLYGAGQQRVAFESAEQICDAIGVEPAEHGLTPRPVDRKVCTGCGHERSLDEFDYSSKGRLKRASRCRPCLGRSAGHPPGPRRRAGGSTLGPHPGPRPRLATLEERLWEKVDRAGKHWLWTRGSAQNVNVDGRPVGANRVAWALEVGPIPPGGRLIRTCLEGRCIHPAHHELVLARGGHALGCRATARRRRIEALSAEEHQRLVDYHLVLRCDPCSYCGAPMETVDHIDAFSRGGAVDWTNLTASCAACNNSKFTSSLLIWLWRKAVI